MKSYLLDCSHRDGSIFLTLHNESDLVRTLLLSRTEEKSIVTGMWQEMKAYRAVDAYTAEQHGLAAHRRFSARFHGCEMLPSSVLEALQQTEFYVLLPCRF